MDTITKDQQELWEATFGSGFESMPWWTRVHYELDTNWDKPGIVALSIEDPERYDAVVTRHVTMHELLLAIEDAKRTCVDACTGQPITTTPGEVDFDACVGDAILQIAVLGEVVYS